MGKKKPKVLRPIPPDDALPTANGPATTGPAIDAVVLAIDPAETSGWAVLAVEPDGVVERVTSGEVVLGEPGSVETVVAAAIDEAAARGKILTLAVEHSKAAYGGSAFGVSGFIGMMRAQGVWLRGYEVAVRAHDATASRRVGRKKALLPSRYRLVEANTWRDGVFGTRTYRDPESGKRYFLQRHHWKHLAVETVRTRFGADAGPDEAEAVLIGLWASRRGRV